MAKKHATRRTKSKPGKFPPRLSRDEIDHLHMNLIGVRAAVSTVVKTMHGADSDISTTLIRGAILPLEEALRSLDDRYMGRA